MTQRVNMSSSPRRRYAVQSVLALGAVSLGVVTVVSTATSGAHAGSGGVLVTAKQAADPKLAPVVDEATRARVEQVRLGAALAIEDMAALDLTGEEAEAVLLRLVEWCQANQARLDAAERAEIGTRQQLAEVERKVRTGEASAQELNGLAAGRQLVGDARAAIRGLYREGGGYAMQAATGKLQAWDRASSFERFPLELRHLPTISLERLKELSHEAERRETDLVGALRLDEAAAAETIRQRAASKHTLLSESERRAYGLE